MRFSITHSKSGALRRTGSSSSQRHTESSIRDDMRVPIYDAACPITGFRFSTSICGRDPIFEKRLAMVLRRFTSLFISRTVSSSTPIACSSSIHAMRELMGVPS